MRHLPIVLLFLGCRPTFTSVDDACHDRVPGGKRVDNGPAVDATSRMNCYRRLTKLGRGKLHRRVQRATELHLDYLVRSPPWATGLPFNIQDPNQPGFRGTTLWERLDHVEYAFDDPFGVGVWEMGFWSDGLTAEERVEYHLPDPLRRQIFLQPSFTASGYAEGVTEDGFQIGYWTIIYQFPSTEKQHRPIVYPQDGQVDVPMAFASDEPLDPLYELGRVGFPITVTFSSDDPVGHHDFVANPYGVHFDDASLTGPAGEVPLRLLEPPGGYPGGLLRYTLIAVPLEVLEPSTTYTFTADVTWSSRSKSLESTFTTAAEPDLRERLQSRRSARGSNGAVGLGARP